MNIIWIHIDHIDNEGGEVWAVQIPDKKKYIVCHEVECLVSLRTHYRSGKQPRAYLVGRGKIRLDVRNGRRKVIVYD